MRLDGGAQVADRRLGVGGEPPRLIEERIESHGHWLGRIDQRIDVVERRPEVHERRVGAPHERWQPLDRLGQGPLLAAERASPPVQVADHAREVVAALRERRHEPRAVHEEPLEHRLVARQLVEEATRGGQAGLR